MGVFLQAAAAILWIVGTSGWLVGGRQIPGLTPNLGLLLFGALLVGCTAVATFLRPSLRKAGAFGFLFSVGAILAQLLLVPQDSTWLLISLGAWLVPLLPLSDPKRDRFHLLAGAIVLLASPLLVGHLALWGPIQVPMIDSKLHFAQVAIWLLVFLFVHYSFHQAATPRGRLEATPGAGRGGLSISEAPLPSASSSSVMQVSQVHSPASMSGIHNRPQGLPNVPQDPRASTAIPRQRAQGAWDEPAMSSSGDEIDPSASQVLSRSILSEQDDQARQQMSRLLGPVVHLMHKVFRSYSSLGFLVDPVSGDLLLDAKFGKGMVLPDARIVPGSRLLGNSVRSGLLTGDVANYGESPEYYPEGERVLSLMALPVRNEDTGDLQALLVVDQKVGRAFSDEHYHYFKRFASIASALVTVQSARTAIQRQATITNTFYDIQSRLTRHLKPDDLLAVLESSLRTLFPLERMTVSLWNPAKQLAQIQLSTGIVPLPQLGCYFDPSDPASVCGAVFRTGREVLSRDWQDGPRAVFESRMDAEIGWRGQEIMGAPFLNDDRQCFGVLTLESTAPGSYQDLDTKLLAAIASIAAGALTRARMYQEMERLATIDGLTQVPNHRHFQTLLNQQLEVASRYGQRIGLMLFDIDHFKVFNDTYGHAIGDLVLKEVARCVGTAIRSSDMLARYGGEEFVVLMPQAEVAGAMQSAERVRAAVENMAIPHEGRMLKVTISIGVCLFPEMASVKQDFIDGADKAMYFSKKSGRNRVTLYGPESEALAQQKEAVGGH
ncbi:MAG: GGDEF domain-containing protein [Fibrobacteres bacterium]|nr:GGDEF domain-containing protein [Fibrobacterota bacterium]